jgi:hypothetical protein
MNVNKTTEILFKLFIFLQLSISFDSSSILLFLMRFVHLQDLEKVHTSSKGRVDLTIGSALDIFGGSGVTYGNIVQVVHIFAIIYFF